MEFDLDFEEIFYHGEPQSITKGLLKNLKGILRSGLDDFSAKEIGISNLILEMLWKGGVLRKYGAIKPSARPRTKWSLDEGNIMLHLSDDPEIHALLQERARRKQSVVQADRFRHSPGFSDCRVAHQPSKRGRTR